MRLTSLYGTFYARAFLYFLGIGLLSSCSQSYELYTSGGLLFEEKFKIQNLNNQVDVLFVIDNSGSMGQEQRNVQRSLKSFLDGFSRLDVDYQLGLISTDTRVEPEHWSSNRGPYRNYENEGPGTLLTRKGNSRFQSSRTMAREDILREFNENLDLGLSGSGSETGLYSTYLFLERNRLDGWNAGFVRPNAVFAVVIVSDEDESIGHPEGTKTDSYLRSDPQKKEQRIEAFVHRLKTIKPGRPDLISYDAVMAPSVDDCPTVNRTDGIPGTGDVYTEVAKKLGGRTHNICEDFSNELGALSERIAMQAGRKFALSRAPLDSRQIEVYLDGDALVQDQEPGFVFDADSNSIYLQGFVEGENDGAEVMVRYLPET